MFPEGQLEKGLDGKIYQIECPMNYPEYKQEYISYDDVRITPAIMVFSEAFDGRRFKEKLVIQNCGKTKAFIRICAPTSYEFEIDTLVRGQFLPPGLSIVRYIRYNHSVRFFVPIANLSIFINNIEVNYKLIVTLSQSKISVHPNIINFGTVDTKKSSEIKSLLIKNEGTKAARFAIDLGRNRLELDVKPKDGIIQPKSQVTMYVEVMSSIPGKFVQEFWIKCESPQRIQVMIEFIVPKLNLLNTPECPMFDLLDFSRTYIGNSMTRSLVIQNESARDTMFCILGEYQFNEVSYERAYNLVRDYKFFKITPLEGRLSAGESIIIDVVFAPIKVCRTYEFMEHIDYALCMLRIMRVNYTDLCNFSEKVPEFNLTSFHMPENTFLSESLNFSINKELANFKAFEFMKFAENAIPRVQITEQSRRVCLHGMFEQASISLLPNSITIYAMKQNKTEKRVLRIKNMSENLPIIVRYKKMASVKIEPNSMLLKPSESIEVSILITPKCLERIKTQVIFELLHPNLPKIDQNYVYVVVGHSKIELEYDVVVETTMPPTKFNTGITPQITHEVGFLTDNIRFNSPVRKPRMAMLKCRSKFSNDLIAFPNDRPKSLRSRQTDFKCRTIFAGIPRVEKTYESQMKKKKLYQAAKLSPKELVIEQQQVSKTLKSRGNALCAKIKTEIKQTQETIKCSSFIPLSPTQLYNIKIEPTHIELNNVAIRSNSISNVTITNHNSFKIDILLISKNRNITFPKGDRFVIQKHNAILIEIAYYAYENGRNYWIVDIIINKNHCQQISLNILVLPRVLKLSTKEICFISSEDCTKTVEVINTLNVAISFLWEIPNSCFVLEPISGSVPKESSISCLVRFAPELTAPLSTEVVFTSETSGYIELLKLSVELIPPKTIFQTEHLVIDNLPLNLPTTHHFFLRNLSQESITFFLQNPNPLEGIRIEPQKGIIHGVCDQYFKVFILLNSCITFDFDVTMLLQNIQVVQMKISGNVIYPNVEFTPNIVDFKKILQYTGHTFEISVRNTTKAPCIIQLQFNDLPGFCLRSSSKFTLVPSKGIKIEPLEKQDLCLHVNPIDAAAYDFHVTIILNGLRFNTHQKSRSLPNDGSVISSNFLDYYSKEMLGLRIKGAVSGALIQISSDELHFEYSPNPHFQFINERDLKIVNVTTTVVLLFLCIEEMFEPFAIKHIIGGEIEKNANGFLCILPPAEELFVKLEFKPKTPGTFKAILPIYVNDFKEGPFNWIYLSGIQHGIIIETNKSCIILEPIPLSCKSTKRIYLEMKYHLTGCSVKSKCDCKNVFINFPYGNTTDEKEKKYTIPVDIEYIATKAEFLDCNIVISCKCKSFCDLNIKCVSENCLLTTHAFVLKRHILNAPFLFHTTKLLTEKEGSSTSSNISTLEMLVNENETSFPRFPEDIDDSYYADHMRLALKALENWVYEQGLYKQRFYKIPEGIAKYPAKIERQDQAVKKVKMVVLTYVQLLTNLAGETVRDCIMQGLQPPKTENERCLQMCTIYFRVLQLLQGHSTYLPHVKPEYLLSYEDYIIVCQQTLHKTVFNEVIEPIMEEKEFILLSKQSWMDLLLQTYKVFVLKRVQITVSSQVPEKRRTKSKSISLVTVGFMKLFETCSVREGNINSVSGNILLAWLEHGFETQRKLLWNEPLPPRSVRYFNLDLRDSLVLAAVTVLYCPYLKRHFQHMFCDPSSSEELYHNAIILIKAWEMINCSLSLRPSDIYKPNLIGIILIVNYLYGYIPSLYPTETIFMEEVTHGQVEVRLIPIHNKNSFPLNYKIVVFKDIYQQISAEPTLLELLPHKEAFIKVFYHPRKYVRAQATVVICGDIKGQRFAKSKAYNINATPTLKKFDDTVCFTGSLYDVFEVNFIIKCPYKINKPLEYEIAFECQKSAINVDELKLFTWKDLKAFTTLPRRIFNFRNTMPINANGRNLSRSVVCPLVPEPNTVNCFYCHPETGDFSLQIVFNVTMDVEKSQFEHLHIVLPTHLVNSKCECTNRVSLGRCPKKVMLTIPNKNHLMWKCIEKMILVSKTEEVRPFWQKYIGNDVGLHIIQYEAENLKPTWNLDCSHIFKHKVNYTVQSISRPKPSATLPSKITIEDTLKEGSFQVPIHVNTDKHPNDFFFTMKSEDNKELRYYKIVFLKTP